jgi:hypothetical protein
VVASEPPSSGHAPPLQPTHGGPLPHWQAPVAEQLSAIDESHVMHAPPLAPHVATDGMLHVPSVAQHPPGHDVESQMHVCPEHRWPCAHSPPEPHEQVPPSHPSATEPQSMHDVPICAHVLDPSVVQLLPEQHPPGHDVASQTQLPWKHR